ncbi:MAG: hypothetical protein FJ009_13320 [Chloroflexi bacterium]|nr:hypothetical protein [Chloroflexota bacterium]
MPIRQIVIALIFALLLALALIAPLRAPVVAAPNAQSQITGPFTAPAQVASFDGDVRRLPAPRAPVEPREVSHPRRIARAPAAPEIVAPRAHPAAPALENPRTVAPLQNFDGLDIYAGGGWVPPDPNGDVGPNHYLQAVNTALGIFSKNGTALAAFSYNTLFDHAFAPCDETNYRRGDPIVLYDPLSDRWLASDFAYANATAGPFYQCIAVSKTSDPVNGGWWLYTINVGSTATPGVNWFNDYPKLAIWSDGIYLSADMFDASNNFQTARVFAFNRDDLIGGAIPRNVGFDVGANYYHLLPSNLRGALPPSGTPNFFAAITEPNLFHLWKFQVTNWSAFPPAATFTGPTNVLVNNFVMPCYAASTFHCVPQLDTPQRVDGLGDRLMMQLQYRNFGGVESLWVNHTVADAAPIGYPTGVRWYEIRNPNGAPIVYQQGTFQPDSNYRWMASLAVDQLGNMALGYSVSSAAMYPAIRYTGRWASDPLGKLCIGETSLIEGTGSQTGSRGYRWGDYSAMTIDPTDDLTFWYTNEYFVTTDAIWRTRIGSFKLGNLPTPPTGPYIYFFPLIFQGNAPMCY